MSIPFSESTNKTGIVEQVRDLIDLDATQWPARRISNSCNNWLDKITGYAIGADKKFQWDDTNQTKLPIGTTDLIINQIDYSFLTDQQGNAIITLTGLSRIDADGKEYPLELIDRSSPEYDISTFGTITGTPMRYDKIADNIIRLDFKPAATITGGLKFYFQRTGSYFVYSDTTKSPGVSPLLHRGFIIASAYDAALAKGLANLQALSIEVQREEKKIDVYFSDRNMDETSPALKQCITPHL